MIKDESKFFSEVAMFEDSRENYPFKFNIVFSDSEGLCSKT